MAKGREKALLVINIKLSGQKSAGQKSGRVTITRENINSLDQVCKCFCVRHGLSLHTALPIVAPKIVGAVEAYLHKQQKRQDLHEDLRKPPLRAIQAQPCEKKRPALFLNKPQTSTPSSCIRRGVENRQSAIFHTSGSVDRQLETKALREEEIPAKSQRVIPQVPASLYDIEKKEDIAEDEQLLPVKEKGCRSREEGMVGPKAELMEVESCEEEKQETGNLSAVPGSEDDLTHTDKSLQMRSGSSQEDVPATIKDTIISSEYFSVGTSGADFIISSHENSACEEEDKEWLFSSNKRLDLLQRCVRQSDTNSPTGHSPASQSSFPEKIRVHGDLGIKIPHQPVENAEDKDTDTCSSHSSASPPSSAGPEEMYARLFRKYSTEKEESLNHPSQQFRKPKQEWKPSCGTTTSPACIRLYKSAAKRLQDLEAARQRHAVEKELEELAECTFQPAVHSNRQRRREGPLEVVDRLYASDRQRQRRLEVSIEERLLEEVKECSFRPEISDHAKLKSTSIDTLYEDAFRRRERNTSSFENKPNSPRSKASRLSRKDLDGRNSPYERLAKQKIQNFRDEGHNIECTFQPRIGREPLRNRRGAGSQGADITDVLYACRNDARELKDFLLERQVGREHRQMVGNRLSKPKYRRWRG